MTFFGGSYKKSSSMHMHTTALYIMFRQVLKVKIYAPKGLAFYRNIKSTLRTLNRRKKVLARIPCQLTFLIRQQVFSMLP